MMNRNWTDERKKEHNEEEYRMKIYETEDMECFTFGAQINVLIIIYNSYGSAYGLSDYLRNSTDINVDLVDNMEDLKQIAEQKSFDFLIIVGELENEEDYRIVRKAWMLNIYSCIILYEHICDAFTEYQTCKNFNEHSGLYGFVYNSHCKMSDFVLYMRALHKHGMNRFSDHFPDEESYIQEKEQSWQKQLADSKNKEQDELEEIEHIEKPDIRKSKFERILENIPIVLCCAILIYTLSKAGWAIYIDSLPYEIDINQRYQYTMPETDITLTIDISIKGEDVTILYEKDLINDENIRNIYSKKTPLTLESAIEKGIVYDSIRLRRYKDHAINKDKLLIYCNMQ